MKTCNLIILVSIVLAIVGFSACNQEEAISNVPDQQVQSIAPGRSILSNCETIITTDSEEGVNVKIPLIAGQNIIVGSVNLKYDNLSAKFSLCYFTTGDWVIKEVHLYVGTLSGVPINKNGQPIPGHFPINETLNPATNSVCYTLSDIPLCGVIVAHAVVSGKAGTETAWSQGCLFTDKNWSMYTKYCDQE